MQIQANPPSLHQHPIYTIASEPVLHEKPVLDLFQSTSLFFTSHLSAVIISLGTALIVLETLEHLSIIRQTNLFFFFEVMLIATLLGASFLLINRLLTSLNDTAQAHQRLQLKHEIGIYLSSSQDLKDVSKRLIQKAAQIAPTANIKLLLPEAHSNGFCAVNCENGEEVIDLGPCHHCLAMNTGAAQPLRLCRQAYTFTEKQKETGSCLPLTQGSRPVGLLHLFVQDHQSLAKQLQLLESASPEMASALSTAQAHQEREDIRLNQKIREVQADIARDLHDTIGQDISYLRMRLNVLADKGSQFEPEIAGEINQMFDVACESYDLMRGTLAVLQSGDAVEMEQFFTRYARQVGERSGFEVKIQHQGQPRAMQPGPMRQLFFIYREALSNIEKHANALQVGVTMAWKDEGLCLSIADDGRGFNPAQVNSGHYGLKFMQDRVNNLHGRLSIYSAVGMGSTIQIQAPY